MHRRKHEFPARLGWHLPEAIFYLPEICIPSWPDFSMTNTYLQAEENTFGSNASYHMPIRNVATSMNKKITHSIQGFHHRNHESH